MKPKKKATVSSYSDGLVDPTIADSTLDRALATVGVSATVPLDMILSELERMVDINLSAMSSPLTERMCRASSPMTDSIPGRVISSESAIACPRMVARVISFMFLSLTGTVSIVYGVSYSEIDFSLIKKLLHSWPMYLSKIKKHRSYRREELPNKLRCLLLCVALLSHS